MKLFYPYRTRLFLTLKPATATVAFLIVTMVSYSQVSAIKNATFPSGTSGNEGVGYKCSTAINNTDSLASLTNTIDILEIRYNHSQKSNLVVRANPAQSELRISIPDNWLGKSIVYSIYNVHGSLLMQKIITNAEQTELVNISDLAVGIYAVKATDGTETAAREIVKLNN